MSTVLIFAWVYAAMIAMAFWESEVEGRNAGARKALGWKFTIRGYDVHAYHIFVFLVMWPLMMSLPLVVTGWDTRLFGVLMSAYASGIILEDFMWYVVNTDTSLKDFNSRFAKHYPWIRAGSVEIPVLYIIMGPLALASWYFLWSV